MIPFLLAIQTSDQPAPQITVQDTFQRNVTQNGITLVDWEGQIANPAIELTFTLPEDVNLPATLNLAGNNSRIHFDKTSSTDRYGLNRQLTFENRDPQTVKVAIFPDRDAEDETHQIILQLRDSTRQQIALQPLNVKVIDHDKTEKPETFPILLDFSKDQTDFTSNQKVRAIVRQAADDWSYFLAPLNLDQVPAQDEPIRLWNKDGFKTQYSATNAEPYTGFLLYISGIQHDEMRAGGAPSLVGKPQTIQGKETTLYRSGSVEFDTRGNYNQLGWFMDNSDEAWWYTSLALGEQHDLYSIALHEMGHALGFHRRYKVWDEAQKAGGFSDPQLTDYLRKTPTLDPSQHFVNQVDPVSGYGAFGSEYLSQMKVNRWLITKTNLLALQAIGYKLRDTSPFQKLAITTQTHVHNQPETNLPITGGVPAYHVQVTKGTLPTGLTLASYGTLKGTAPIGKYPLTIQIQDQDPTTEPIEHQITIQIP